MNDHVQGKIEEAKNYVDKFVRSEVDRLSQIKPEERINECRVHFLTFRGPVMLPVFPPEECSKHLTIFREGLLLLGASMGGFAMVMTAAASFASPEDIKNLGIQPGIHHSDVRPESMETVTSLVIHTVWGDTIMFLTPDNQVALLKDREDMDAETASLMSEFDLNSYMPPFMRGFFEELVHRETSRPQLAS